MLDLKTQNRIGIICLFFSILFAFISIFKIFLYEYISAGDAFWHYSNEINLIQSLQDFKGLFTCFSKGLGTPLLSFYQPLFYLIVAAVHFISVKTFSVYLIHNAIVVILFSVYPLSVFYFSRSFGLSILKSGVISIFSLFAVSSCGHTLEACLSLGVHTQLIGTVFAPIVLGALHRLSFSKNQAVVFAVFTISSLCIVLGHAVYFLLIVYIVPLYLICFAVWYGWENFLLLLKKLFLSGVIILAISSFWLVPFILMNSEYRYISSVERSGNSIYHSLTVKDFVHTFLKGELLDNTGEQSPLIVNEGRDKGLRWPDNSNFKRYYLFTIFSIAGFLLFLFNLKKFRDLYFLFLFLFGIALFLSTDDVPWLKFLPFMSSFQNIRAILIIELMCSVFSGMIFTRLFSLAMNFLIRKFENHQKIKSFIFKVTGILLLFFLATVLFFPLHERYRISKKLTDFSAQTKTGELKKRFP